MPYPSLPVECYLEILSCVSGAPTLALLAQVSRKTRELVLPLLYRDVSLASESAVRQYCRTIENDPALALLVKSFSIASSATPQDVSSDHHDFLAGIHHALKCMVSLADLRIRLVEQPPYQQRHWIFEGTTFQLRHLELRMDYDTGLIDFLTHQPSLESLTLLGAVPDHLSSMRLDLPPSALPKLSHFHGHYTQALVLIPHRPVRSVHITQVDDLGEFEPSDVFVCLKDTIEAIAHSTGPLEEITFDDEDADYGLLEVVLSNLPDLKAATLFVPQHGHSWRRYSAPQWPAYVQSKTPERPIALERLNIGDSHSSPAPVSLLSTLTTTPNFNPSFAPNPSTPRTTFHAALYASFFPSDQVNPFLSQSLVAHRWKQAFPALGQVQFTSYPQNSVSA